ncbi:MAG: hypothetical protein PHF86_01370 [Candidatus Nanoarchaeia archaeon]|nr:hypothetical protein [Candidatus Nanoarchaeia archaeon]
MAVSELFNTLCCCSCGGCCSKDKLCNQCEIATLKANGFSENLVNEIHGLKYKSKNHSNSFEFSELYYKLKELNNRYLINNN